MISPEKIDEWIREAEERPASASILLRFIANRLSDLATRNEELLAENIDLRTGKRVEDYESRIANLEYQVDLLKRQFGADAMEAGLAAIPQAETVSIFVYNPMGQILRLEIGAGELASGQALAELGDLPASGDEPPRLLLTGSQEELLFVFDSGRTEVMPAAVIPAATGEVLRWDQASLQEPRGDEALAVVVPIAKMTLFEFCLQFSRRGYAKKLREDFFETCLASSYIGSGVKLKLDRTCGLAFSGKEDFLVLASHEGYLISLDVDRLPFAIEEVIKLGAKDFLVSGFATSRETPILAITRNGKVIHRDGDWLQPASSFKTKGQPVFSRERYAAGVRLVGATTVQASDWCVILDRRGRLTAFRIQDLLASGSVFSGEQDGEVLDFSTFSQPGAG